jgi:uncharacterized protein YwqG
MITEGMYAAIHRHAPEIAARIKPLVRNSIIIKTQRAQEADLIVGGSEIGGRPDLPPDIEWPRWNDTPLSFIAQFNLGEIAEYDMENALPHAGLLYFFYEADEQPWGNAEERGSWKVLYYTDEISRLSRTAPPTELSKYGYFEPCALAFSIRATLPSWDSALIEQINLSQEEKEAYSALDDAIHEANDETEAFNHKLLGYPDQIQGDMQVECQLRSNGVEGLSSPEAKELEPGAVDWRLLFQVDSDENPDMQWGDSGCIYYWIRNDDLQAQRFDNAWLILQCF